MSNVYDQFQTPIEVYKLVEKNDSSEIVALLRSNEPITRPTRDALANWLEGKPVHNRKRGRPITLRMELQRTILNLAIDQYKSMSAYLNKRKCFYGRADILAESVAKKYSLDPEYFLNQLKRSKKSRAK